MNRFLFLESDLKSFTGDPGKFVKSRSVYSTQKTPAAVAGAVIAGAGLGWKIFEFAWNNAEGDIYVKLARLEGAKHPSDDEEKYKNKGVWKEKTVKVYGKVVNKLVETSAKFDLRFKYNGHSVGYIDMDHTHSNDSVFWGLHVEAKLMVDPNNYKSNKGGQLMSMIEVTFNYRFTRTGRDDIIKIKRYKLYGDGTVIEK
ncbi:hypothetical protein [Sinomicrobium weinanense]|uniref:Uncharacterized protein n=1 Tax=Sinomicrobium weinanense TaxID=2842200 RepID=A0A926Q0C7_9FLAO|nr:hypothetical protein [Sinomicrobium weinanense]MBC9794797.1 hypothetical protein [Sinomicrobium weinanense]MBU3125056.1 hypothetical protein [Sinomicrobium weinanense]